MTSIEKHIKDYIECTYNCVFRGNVIVEINGDIYNLALQLNSQLAPINLAIQGTQEQFLEYVKK